MDSQNSQKRSPRDSAKSKQQTSAAPDTSRSRKLRIDEEEEPYFDRSNDHVARVRAAKEAAQRRMEEFGNIEDYDITIIKGRLKEEADEDDRQPMFDFERADSGCE